MAVALRPWGRFWVGPWSRRKGLGGRQFPLEVFLLGLVLIAVPYFSTNNIANLYLETAWTPRLHWTGRSPSSTG